MKITVIGAGSWGTALALHFAHHNNEVALWTRNPDQIRTLQADRENKRGLPGFPFPESLTVYADLGEALKDSQLALIVTSVAGLRSSAELLKQHNAADIPVLAACKGFEQDTGLLTFQVLKEVLPNNKKIGVLSGPSFAQELAAQLPCAVVLASENKDWVEETTAQLNTNVMRLYGSTDVIGVAVGGAVKNVMAIATGLSDGLEYGLNARAALVTRGLAEITRLAIAMGAQPKTMMGLAGIGDLIVKAPAHSRATAASASASQKAKNCIKCLSKSATFPKASAPSKKSSIPPPNTKSICPSPKPCCNSSAKK